MILIGIALAIILELAFLGWSGRPRIFGRVMLWLLVPAFALLLAKFGQGSLPPQTISWLYFAVAVLFSLAIVLYFTVDQSDKIRRRARPGQSFSHSAPIKALFLGLFLIAYGLYDDSWYLLLSGGAVAIGLSVAILWDRLLPGTLVAPKKESRR